MEYERTKQDRYSKIYNYLDIAGGRGYNPRQPGGTGLQLSEMSTYFSTLLHADISGQARYADVSSVSIILCPEALCPIHDYA